MAEVGLSEYCEEVKELIKAGALDEATAICRHLLEQFPKYIMPYRLLGEVCLEREEYGEAANLFTRVLGADPEDVVAHVGLTVVYDEEKNLDEAIWHLERAFEMAPGNPEIRQELKRLYGQREGKEPSRVKLTPAALGRLYFKEGLYERAMAEFRALLEQDPERVDLKVALAEALWRQGRHREAAEACQEILEVLPNCLKANLISGLIWRESGQAEEGEALFLLAQAMDPEGLFAQEFLSKDMPWLPERVLIPRLEEIPAPPMKEAKPEKVAPPLPEMGEAVEGVPEWLKEMEEKAEEAVPPPPAEEVPEWLKGLVRPAEEVEAEEVSPPEEVPEWLREFKGEAEVAEEAVEGEFKVAEAPPVEVRPEEEMPPPPVVAVPEEEEVVPEAIVEEVEEEVPEAVVEEVVAEEAEVPPTIDGLLERLASHPEDHQARLGLVRLYLAQGEREEALPHLRGLVREGQLLQDAIQELEAVAQEAPEHLPTQQLLGDAYMKAGRLEEAIEKYRWLRGRIKS